MKTTITRFPLGRRVKLILTTISAIFALFVMPPAYAFAQAAQAAAQPGSGNTNLIRTSYSRDNYAVIECAGNTVAIKGMYTFDRLVKVHILHCDESTGSYSLRSRKDGSFEAEITVTPAEDGEFSVIFTMDSGTKLRYLLLYKGAKGWYFPINSLAETNRMVFDHIFEAPTEASALYLSANDDPKEINSALEQISGLTKQITEGIDDDYEKAKAISQFVSKTIYYDYDARTGDADLETIALHNVLKSSKTVCAGFANLFCAMAEAAGIDAVNIKGGVTSGDADHPIPYSKLERGIQNHEFAAFRYEKEDRWVWVDACWDGSGNYSNGTFTDGLTKVMYFDISDEALSFNHRADKAERRHYFAAKPETQPIETEAEQTEETPAQEQTTGAAERPVTLPETGSDSEETTSAAQTMPQTEQTTPASAQTTTVKESSAGTLPEQADKNAVYIVIIAALIIAVAAAAAILIKVILNGRKN